MHGRYIQLQLLFLSFIGTCYRASAAPPVPDRYIFQNAHRLRAQTSPPQEYIDPTLPPPAVDQETPACSVRLLQHDFANTYGSPPVSVNYTPPDHCNWTHAVLDFSVACAGDQYDRIAAIWIDGAEILRTSTAEPTETGVSWNVRKDVTRYSSLLRLVHKGRGLRDDNETPVAVASVMLENIVNDVYTGVYHVNVSLDFYGGVKGSRFGELGQFGFANGKGNMGLALPGEKLGQFLVGGKGQRSKDLEFDSEAFSQGPGGDSGSFSSLGKEKVGLLLGKPADMIIPISNEKGDNGFWFRIYNESNVHTKSVIIPRNSYRAVLEVFISSHSEDEFWYSNPPTSYIEQNNLPTNRGNGAFRQVFATIDGLYSGSVVPFPVVFTGGINPLFWQPVVGLGAFDLPSYGIDMTPFLGNLLNGKPHEFGLGVTDGIPYWLVDANLHLWLDEHSPFVTAKLVRYQAPPISISRKTESKHLDGKFKLKAERGALFSGWVNSSIGNLTTLIGHQLKFKSSVEFKNNGDVKEVYTKIKFKTDIKTEESPNLLLFRGYHKSKYPIRLLISTLPGVNNTYTERTNLSHVMYDKSAITVDQVPHLRTITDKQNADGWMQVQDHSVLSGSASTLQTYSYRDGSNGYVRKVSAQDGVILNDQTSTARALPL